MNKTIHRTFSTKHHESHIAILPEKLSRALLINNLTDEMKGYLQLAADDLLQPRPQAVEQLLKMALDKN